MVWGSVLPLCADGDNPTVTYRLLPWDTDAGGIFAVSGSEYVELNGAPNALSPEYSYSGPSPMVLYKKETLGDGSSAFMPCQSLALKAGVSSYLLLLYRTDAQANRAQLYPLTFPSGGGAAFILFNFTSLPIKAKLGEYVIDLGAGQSHAVGEKKLGLKDYAFFCKIASQPEGRWKLIYNDFIHLPPKATILFFISDQVGQAAGNEYGGIRTKKVVDYPLSEEARVESLTTQRVKSEIGAY
jgi:hypothetical protein